MAIVFLALCAAMLAPAAAYNNGAPHSRTPPLGWSSWVGLGPVGEHPIFDYCDEASVKVGWAGTSKLGDGSRLTPFHRWLPMRMLPWGSMTLDTE